jgi:hypothetical protein
LLVSNRFERFFHPGMNHFSSWELTPVHPAIDALFAIKKDGVNTRERTGLTVIQPESCVVYAIGLSGRAGHWDVSKTAHQGDVIMKSGLAALCATAVCAAVAFSAAPAGAQNRLKTCNDEWASMKAAGTVGDKKYADFRKECLARTAATPSTEEPATPGATAAAPSAAKPAPAPKTATPAKPAAPAAAGEAVFPTAVSPKYSKESAGRARMHTCLDQYNENKASNGNGGLNWIQKGGGYYSECNKRLKG